MSPDLQITYEILVNWAKRSVPQSYTQLSKDYEKETGDWHEPHGSWFTPLGEINVRLSTIGAPAISALVILKEKNEPGNKFWGCADNVPQRPNNEEDRIAKWLEIVNDVKKFEWPEKLP